MTARHTFKSEYAENMRVLALKCHHNNTGFRGVWWDDKKSKFFADVCRNSRTRPRIRLGGFLSVKAAALAYDRVARLEYGSDACLNFPEAGENGIIASRSKEGLCIEGHDLNTVGYKTPHGKVNCRTCNTAAQRRCRARQKARSVK